MVHEKIFKGSGYKRLKLPDYISELAQYIVSSYKPFKVKLDIQIDDFMINLTQVIPLGMLINELMVNSIKHAFDNQPNPRITIEMSVKDKNRLFMIYKDNGRGFPKGFKPEKTDTLGFQIIRSLTKEMDGDFSVISDGGVKYDFSFTLPGHPD